MKRILFISHDSNLTGAPILLLHILRVLKDDYEIKIILKKDGPLRGEFEKLAPVIFLKSSDYNKQDSFNGLIFSRIKYFFRLIKSFSFLLNADVIFSNTITNGRLLKIFRFFKLPVITYVHELKSVMEYFSTNGDTDYTLKLTSLFLYPSRVVRDNLSFNYAVENARLEYFPYYFPLNSFKSDYDEKLSCRKEFISKWNLPNDAKIIVGMGSVSKRKGTDRFVDVAQHVLSQNPNFYFFWIGECDDSEFTLRLIEQHNQSKFKEKIIFTGLLPYSPISLLPFDLFFLSSIEDPYPLVVLEAAFNWVPVLCFESSGGGKEFLGQSAGYILNNEAKEVVAEKIISIFNDCDDLLKTSLTARERAIEKHADINLTKEMFGTIINKIK